MPSLADLYVVLSVQTGEFTAGLDRAAAAGEDFTEKFTAGTREAADAAKELGDSATESFTAAGGAADELAAAQARVTGSAGAAADGEKALADMDRLAAEMAADATVQQKLLNDARMASVDATLASARAQGTLKDAEIASGDASEASAGKTDAAGAAADGAGSHFHLMGAAALAGTAIAVKMAGDYQQSMTRLVTSAGEAQKNLGMVSRGILAMSVATNTSTKQLASGMYYVESAGFHGAQGLTVLKAAAEGAQAEGADLATVANAVTSGLNAYGMGASHATSFTNQMVTAVAHGKMTMQDLADSISTVLPAAAKAGLSFAQVGGAISTMTAQGMSAQQATLDLRHTILSLQTPTQVQVTEMQQLGVNSNDLAKNLGKNGLSGTVSQLEESVLKGMGPAGMVLLKSFNQSKLAAQSAQAEISAMPPALAKVARAYQSGQISAAQWQKIVYKGSESTGAKNLLMQFATTENAAKGFNTQLKAGGGDAQTFTAALSKMMGGTTGLQTALMVGGSHMATFRANTDAIAAAGSRAGQNVQNWALIQHNFNFQLGQAGKSLEAVAISFGSALLPAATAVMHVLAAAGGFLARNAIACKALAVVVGVLLAGALEHGLVKALKLSTGGLKDMGDGIKGAIGYFRAGEGEASKFSTQLGSIKSAASSAWQGLQSAWSGVTGLFKGATTATEAETAATELQTTATESQTAAAAAAMEAQEGLDVAMDANPAGIIVIAIAALVAAFVILWMKCSAFRDFWKAAWKDVQKAAVSAWHFIDDDMIHPLEKGIDTLVSWVRGHWKLLATILATVLLGPVGGLVVFIAAHWKQITALTSRLIGDVTSFFRSLPGKILAALKGLPGDMLTLGKNIVEGLINGIKDMAGAAVSAAKSVGSSIVSGVKGMLGISSPSKVMRDIGLEIGRGLVQGLEGSKSAVSSSASKLATYVREAFNANDITQGTANSLTAYIQRDNARLQHLANERTAILKEIATAKKYATTTAQAEESQYGVVNAAGGGTAPATAASILATLKTNLTSIRAFKSNIQKLAKMGLNKAYINQIIQAGPVAGGQIAQELASGSWSQIQQINTVEKQITSASTSMGKTAANAMYDSGKDAGKGFLSGLEHQQKSIEDVMKRIAKAMVSTIRRELGISSPSTVMRQHGRDAARGFALGIEDGITGTAAASARLAGAMSAGARGGAAGSGGGTVIHLEPHITVQGYIGNEEQLVSKLLPPLQKVILEIDRINPGTGNGLSLGTAAGRAA